MSEEVAVLDVFRGSGALLIVWVACEEDDAGAFVARRIEVALRMRDGAIGALKANAEAFLHSCWNELDALVTLECLAAADTEGFAVVSVLRGRVTVRPAYGRELREEIDGLLAGGRA